MAEINESAPSVALFIIKSISKFAHKKALTFKEACNYLVTHKAIDFVTEHYEVQHLLSLDETVDDMTAICLKNGGGIL